MELSERVAIDEAADIGFEGFGGKDRGRFLAWRRRRAGFFDDELIVKESGDLFDPFRGAIPFQRGSLGGAVEEPFGLEVRGETDQRNSLVATGIPSTVATGFPSTVATLLHIEGDEKLVAAVGEAGGAAGGKQQYSFASVASHTIGKRREDGLEEGRIVTGPVAAGDMAAKLVENSPGLRLPIGFHQRE